MLPTTLHRLVYLAIVGLAGTAQWAEAQNTLAPQNEIGRTAPVGRLQPQPLPAVQGTHVPGAPLAQVASLLPEARSAQQAEPAGQLGPPAAQPGFGGPPFQLDRVEQQFVDQILHMWETESAKIKTFDCQFERWEYDAVFGPGHSIPMVKSEGQLSYSKPDKGSFKINKLRRWKKANLGQETWEPGDWVLEKDQVGEHWVCDGKAIHEYNHLKKQLVVRLLPPELHGTAIVDGPLPFLFGAEAEGLKARYWIRSPASDPTSIFLEAYPRRQADAANYQRVDVRLDRKRMMPTAIQVHMPNGESRAVYMFEKPTVNGKLNALFGEIFNAPRKPLGWTRIVEDLPRNSPSPGPQASAPQPDSARK
ncbi:MAG: TIGR03009 domain-containing protein [Pirellulales bacterium]|nr:TIGR03009 domain-containing protein [Pirellulales bacterium]